MEGLAGLVFLSTNPDSYRDEWLAKARGGTIEDPDHYRGRRARRSTKYVGFAAVRLRSLTTLIVFPRMDTNTHEWAR
jgi:hypothetical protein